MQEEYSSSSKVLKLLYEAKYEEFKKRFAELVDPRVIYVTDLVSCTHKYHLRHVMPGLVFVFEPHHVLGDLVHLGLESFLEIKGFHKEYPVEKNVKLDNTEYVVKGRIDAFDIDNGVVIEIKTARSSQGTPHKHHIEQVRFYMYMVGASEGILIYITPDRIIEFSIKEPSSEEVLLQRIREVIEDKVHPRWDWECKYCLFSKVCPFKKS